MRLFKLVETVSNHKFEYESAVATTLTGLVRSYISHSTRVEQPAAAPKVKVVKSHLKPQVKKTEIRNLYACHFKRLMMLIARNVQHDALLVAGVPVASIVQTVGDKVDIVEGDGPASDDIWGPVL